MFDKNASNVDFVVEVSRVGLMFSNKERLFTAIKVTIFWKFALLTKKFMLSSPHSMCLASGSIRKVSKKSNSL